MNFILFIALLIFALIQSSNSSCTEEGIFNNPNDDSCRTYIFCFRLSGDNMFLQKLYTCPDGTFFDMSMKTCLKNNNCNLPTLPTTTIATTKQPETLECTAQGRFPDENDATCTRYSFCYYLPTRTYIKMDYICPIGTKFDPKLQTCSSAFKCNISTTTVTISPTTTVQESYSCTKQGRFVVENDSTCRLYHYCLYLPNRSYAEYTYQCPSTLKFDPTTQSCSINYSCPKSTVTPTTQKNTFICPSSGRFPDDADASCKTYFYCVQLPNGDIAYQTYQCPENLKFDPGSQTCSDSYKCPSKGGTTPHVDTTTFSVLTTPFEEETTASYSVPSSSDIPDIVSTYSVTDDSSDTTITTDNNSEYTDASTSNSNVTSDSMTEICESVGRFADSSSETFESYFLCAMGPNGKLINFKYKCGANEFFDPELKQCSSSYKCQSGVSTNFPEFSTSNDMLKY